MVTVPWIDLKVNLVCSADATVTVIGRPNPVRGRPLSGLVMPEPFDNFGHTFDQSYCLDLETLDPKPLNLSCRTHRKDPLQLH